MVASTGTPLRSSTSGASWYCSRFCGLFLTINWHRIPCQRPWSSIEVRSNPEPAKPRPTFSTDFRRFRPHSWRAVCLSLFTGSWCLIYIRTIQAFASWSWPLLIGAGKLVLLVGCTLRLVSVSHPFFGFSSPLRESMFVDYLACTAASRTIAGGRPSSAEHMH
jgi:hypothetical protein